MCFKRAIRTNNDVEGWHNMLNTRAHHSYTISFYILVSMLHSEAILILVQQQLVYEDKLRKYQKKQTPAFQDKLFQLRREYRKANLNNKSAVKKQNPSYSSSYKLTSHFLYYKRISLACASRLEDTLCPPEAPYGRLESH